VKTEGLDSVSMPPVPISPVKVGHIDDVQELRKTKPRTIPQRFVRDMTERPTLSTTPLPPSNTHMPVIDFSKLTNGNKEDVLSEIFNLATACEEWGFFQVNTIWFLETLLLFDNYLDFH